MKGLNPSLIGSPRLTNSMMKATRLSSLPPEVWVCFLGQLNVPMIDGTKVTLEQLKKWNVKYHELHLGKPAGDFYIDDKALKDTDFLNDGQVCWVATHLLHQS